jgi:hypothetical protein
MAGAAIPAMVMEAIQAMVAILASDIHLNEEIA